MAKQAPSAARTRRAFLRLALGSAVGLAAACTAPAAAPTPTTAPAKPPAAPSPAAGASPSPAAVAAASPVAQAPASKRPLDIVKRGNLRGITFQGAIAKARGYFEEQGIDDQETIMDSGATQQQAMAAGQVDVIATSITAAFFNTILGGFKQPLVFDNWHLEKGDRSYSVAVRPDLVDRFKDLTDLKGTTSVSSTPFRDGGSWFIAEKMFRAKGMTLEDVKWERLPFPDMLTALANKGVDTAWIIEPFITLGKQRNLLVPWLDLSDFDPGAQIAGMAFSERLIRERTDVARRWTIAAVRGSRDYNDFRKGKNRDVIGPILSQHTGLPLDVVPQVGFGPLNPDGRINADSVAESHKMLVAWGLVPRELPRNEIVDHQFVEYAVQQLGPYQG